MISFNITIQGLLCEMIKVKLIPAGNASSGSDIVFQIGYSVLLSDIVFQIGYSVPDRI